jgi:tetratricopeptide (TPR) repeat protein
MPAFDESFDYLTMLGLDPGRIALQDTSEVRDAIRRKRKEWTAQAINPLYQQQARANLERAKQFEQILDNPPALQAYVAYQQEVQETRRHQQERQVAPWLAAAAGPKGKTITVAQRELVLKAAEERGIPPQVVDAAVKSRGLRVAEDGAAVQPAAALPYLRPALDRALLTQIHNHLRVLEKKSFYELLDLPPTAAPGRIVSTARMAYERWSKTLPKTSECVAWEKGLQACMTYLKDDEAKRQYDHALFNHRLDEYLWRIDLVLAAGALSRDSQILLARIGVQEFGFSQGIANQCITQRAASRGVTATKPLIVKVELPAQAQCPRCHGWNSERARHCVHCSASLERRCRNPACGQPLAPGAKQCDSCALSVGRAGQYVELLRLVDALLDAGSYQPALEACQLAEQILPTPEIAARVERAGRLKALTTSVRTAAADKQWNRVHDELSKLNALAPKLSHPGLPKLDDVAQYLVQMRRRIEKFAEMADPRSAAKSFLDVLAQWTDSPEALNRLWQLAESLESQGDAETALEIVNRLASLQPLNEEFQARSLRLGRKVTQVREWTEMIEQPLGAFRRALADRRLYAAERALLTLEELDYTKPVEREAAELRARLAEIRAEVAAIRELGPREGTRDEFIRRTLALLEKCRDCREAVAALQAASPDPPGAPREISVQVYGTRRTISWAAPAEGKAPEAFVLQRSVLRPGTRLRDQPFETLYEGPELHFVDDDVLYGGSIVRYTVHSVQRGSLRVEGHVLRDFEVASPPVAAEPILIWQEPHGARAVRRDGLIELRWHPPAGARQVLIERWRGGRGDRPENAQLVAAAAPDRLIDREVVAGETCSYRLYCIYDGPQGDFITPGVIVTETVAADDSVSSAGSEAVAAFEEVLNAAPEQTVTERGDDVAAPNPLKRLGIWPPAKSVP